MPGNARDQYEAALSGAEWRKAARKARSDLNAARRRGTTAKAERPAEGAGRASWSGGVPGGVTLKATARCHGCGWTARPDTMAAAVRAAVKHRAPGHPAAVIAEPAGVGKEEEHGE